MKSTVSTLPNGLTVATITMPKVETISTRVWVNTGTRNELPHENGISHFLEHMLFKGTKKRSAQKLAEEIDAVGGYINAYTSREQTVYYTKLLKHDAELGFDILSDMVFHSSMDKTELKREVGVVIQEIGQSFDTPDDIIYDFHQEQAYPDQPMGRPVLGTKEIISKMKPDKLFDYMERHYQPSRMILSVAGNITHKEVMDHAHKYFNVRRKAKHTLKEISEYQGGMHKTPRDLEQLHLLLGFEGVNYHSDDAYAAHLLTGILGGGMSSRLFQEVREKRGLAYSVMCYNTTYADSGMVNVYAGTSGNKAVELLKVITDELNQATKKIVKADLDRAKAQARAGLLMEQESSSALSEELARHLSIYGRHIPNTEILKKIDAVTQADVKKVAKKIFHSGKPTLTVLGDVKKVPAFSKVEAMLG
ncbi:MAG: insulinase family protein [Proteobacteria bacterium]|nr:insulinase family protein [Pseudomonadota bacterium]